MKHESDNISRPRIPHYSSVKGRALKGDERQDADYWVSKMGMFMHTVSHPALGATSSPTSPVCGCGEGDSRRGKLQRNRRPWPSKRYRSPSQGRRRLCCEAYRITARL